MTFSDAPPPPTKQTKRPPTSIPDAPRGFLTTRARIVLGLLLVGSLVGLVLVFALISPATDEPPRNSAITAIYPAAGDQILRQDSIFIELDPSYTGRIETVLLTGGEEVDVRQAVDYIDGLNRYTYTPNAESPTGVLEPGRHCATAFFWEVGQPESTGRRHSWCFSVH